SARREAGRGCETPPPTGPAEGQPPAPPALGERGVRGERRARPPLAADDRGAREPQLANHEGGPQDARVGQDRPDVLHVLRLLEVGGADVQAVPATREAAESDDEPSARTVVAEA